MSLVLRWVNTKYFLAKCNGRPACTCNENPRSKMTNYVSVNYYYPVIKKKF